MHLPEYLDTIGTSQLTGISVSTLEKWRVYGGGIPFIKAGRSVKYALADVRSWMALRRVTSTSESSANQRSSQAVNLSVRATPMSHTAESGPLL